MPREVRVAVIGSGLAGLTAAYLLTTPSSKDEDVVFDVHLFEKVSLRRGCLVDKKAHVKIKM